MHDEHKGRMGSGTLVGILKPSLYWFLAFIPISVYLEHFQAQAHLWIFFASCLAIIPLAGLWCSVRVSRSKRLSKARARTHQRFSKVLREKQVARYFQIENKA